MDTELSLREGKLLIGAFLLMDFSLSLLGDMETIQTRSCLNAGMDELGVFVVWPR